MKKSLILTRNAIKIIYIQIWLYICSHFDQNKSRAITPSEHGDPECNYCINNSQEFTFTNELVINLELYI